MIIALAGQKGGVGKTTTALNLAMEWFSRGHSVLVVDADPQGSSRTFAEVASELGQAAPVVVSMGAGLHRPDQLPRLSERFDVTVIDCPPRHGEIQRAALMVADLAILPCGPSAVDAWALGESLDLAAKARVIRPELLAVVLITRKIARTAIGRGARSVLDDCGLPLLEAELGLRVAFQEAPAAGQGVTQYEPSGAAAREVRKVIKELEALMKSKEVEHAA